jgi:hypothetical protein
MFNRSCICSNMLRNSLSNEIEDLGELFINTPS